jgi:drug/metabolite transporter (DMT)-like permease
VKKLFPLVVTGILLGSLFPLGRAAAQAGVAPFAWPFIMLLGGSFLLGAVAIARREALPFTRAHVRYYAVAGLLSFALPNAILFTVIPKLGAGLSAVAYALPPLLTVALSALLRIERPSRVRLVGIALGFVGTMLIVAPRGSLPSGDLYGWMVLALAIPLSLASGNVYRTAAWPKGTSPLVVTAGMLAGGALWLAVFIVARGRVADFATLGHAPRLALVQVVLAALQYLLFMHVQREAGPVYVSQVGYIATGVGLASGALVFGETYSPWILAACAVIAAGVFTVNRAGGHGPGHPHGAGARSSVAAL